MLVPAAGGSRNLQILARHRMSASVANDLDTATGRLHRGSIKKIALFAAKFLVTGACFWYVARQVDLRAVLVVYAALLLAGLAGLLLVPKVAPVLARWRYSRWIATLASDARRVLLGPKSPAILAIGCLIHALTILVVWSLGRAQGLALPLP